ncbi:Dienelactone hydrolase [Pedobacter nyackensis]|uniref:Dienelactone hydrolase n=2 Tax=Pedobacter nyackensis TaxID=475255 RepID=A0A1W2EYI7_9SPHI|nr:Dienelactone hydrolase [Pedobacter nyackensis]
MHIMMCFLLISNIVSGQSESNPRKAIWTKISPYFAPPAEHKDKYGDFKSPLKFYSGKEVKSKADWAKRRKEIADRWNGMMGTWPPFLKDQKMEFLDTIRKDGFTQYRVRFKWTPNEVTEGYLSVPDGKGKMPAVITVFYEPETAITKGKLERDFAYQLTNRGFITLSIGTKQASLDKTFSIYYPNIEQTRIQPLSALGYAAANAWYVLSAVPEVDASRIGIMGHSFGGKWAMFASCLFDKFACAVWSDPGIVFNESRESVNYWEPWYLGYQPKPWRKRGLITQDNPVKGLYPKLVAEGYNLHELHALMAPRPFLVSGGSEDPKAQWIPLNHTIKVNNLLGAKNRVAMTNRELHSPNPESNEVAFLFFEYFLKYNGTAALK